MELVTQLRNRAHDQLDDTIDELVQAVTVSNVDPEQPPVSVLGGLFDYVISIVPNDVLFELQTRLTEHEGRFIAQFGELGPGDRLRALSLALGEIVKHPEVTSTKGVERPVSGVGGPKSVPLSWVVSVLYSLCYNAAIYAGNYRTYSLSVQGGSTSGGWSGGT